MAMLSYDIRSLASRAVEVDGTLAADDPVWRDDDVRPSGPVHVVGRLSAAGPGRYYFSGHLEGEAAAECRRCLTDVQTDIDIDVDAAVFSSDPEAADDPDFYPLLERASHIDIRDVVREELALAAPARLLLCREDCAGLCLSCGADLNAGPCSCSAPVEPV